VRTLDLLPLASPLHTLSQLEQQRLAFPLPTKMAEEKKEACAGAACGAEVLVQNLISQGARERERERRNYVSIVPQSEAQKCACRACERRLDLHVARGQHLSTRRTTRYQ
jgi:hypothetical protein